MRVASHLARVEAAHEDSAAPAGDGGRGRREHRRRRHGGTALVPFALPAVVDPRVVQCGGLVVAAEEDHGLARGVVDDGAVAARRRLGLELGAAPGVGRAVVEPGGRGAGGVGGEAAAEQQRLVAAGVVAHGGPRDGPARRGMAWRLEVGPGVRGRIQGEGAPVAVVEDALPPRVPAGHVEGVDGAGPLHAVEVPPADAIRRVVAAHHLEPRPLVVLQAVRPRLPVDPEGRVGLGFPLALLGRGERRLPPRQGRVEGFELVAQIDVARRLLAAGAPEAEPVHAVGVDRAGEGLAARAVLAMDQRPGVGRQRRVVRCGGRLLGRRREPGEETCQQPSAKGPCEGGVAHGEPALIASCCGRRMLATLVRVEPIVSGPAGPFKVGGGWRSRAVEHGFLG